MDSDSFGLNLPVVQLTYFYFFFSSVMWNYYTRGFCTLKCDSKCAIVLYSTFFNFFHLFRFPSHSSCRGEPRGSLLQCRHITHPYTHQHIHQHTHQYTRQYTHQYTHHTQSSADTQLSVDTAIGGHTVI